MKDVVRIKGGMVTATHLVIADPCPMKVSEALRDFQQHAPSLIKGMPVVLDFGSQTPDAELISQLATVVREAGANPFAVKGVKAIESALASSHLSFLGQAREKQAKSEQGDANVQIVHTPALVVDGPIRSGQQVYARNTDLIVRGNVSYGAEVFADGNVHIYGALRGRAAAGLSGQSDAQIFCQSLEPELVVIDGDYILRDAIPKEHINKPANIFKRGESLIFNSL